MITSVLDLFPPVSAKVHRPFDLPKRPAFEPKHAAASGFSRANAWWLAEMSLLAYHEPDVIRGALTKAGFQLAEFLNGESTQGFVAVGKAVVIVAFRGTQVFRPGLDPLASLSEVVADNFTDVKAGLVEASSGEGRVHAGFFEGEGQVRKQLDAILDRPETAGLPLWMTGHSLGGALAMIAAARRASRVQGIYVYGAPRVGDADFGRTLDGRLVCFVHGSDLVSSLPPLEFDFLLLPPAVPPHHGRYHQLGRIEPFARVRLDGGVMLGLLQLGLGFLDLFRAKPVTGLVDHAPLLYVLHFRSLL